MASRVVAGLDGVDAQFPESRLLPGPPGWPSILWIVCRPYSPDVGQHFINEPDPGAQFAYPAYREGRGE